MSDRNARTTIEAPYNKIVDLYKEGRVVLLNAYVLTQLSLMLNSINDKG